MVKSKNVFTYRFDQVPQNTTIDVSVDHFLEVVAESCRS
jgi:hypothetical protein